MQSTYHQINVPMQEENFYLKVLVVEEQIAISGHIMVRILQKLDVVVFQSWNPNVMGHRVSAEFWPL